MIIIGDNFFTNSDHPNDDWTGEADYIIDDNSEIAQKVISYFPNQKLIVEDGTVVDVTCGSYTPEQLEVLKTAKIAETKQLLSEWLSNNPYQFTDGKYYSVTEEKQSLLNSNLASYERATNTGIEYPLKWNSTGDECTTWTYQDLLTLSLSIAAYVAPKVSTQQSLEIAIKNAKTKDEIDAIEISYN